MGFVRNIAGLLLTLPIAYAVSTAADLQLYAAVCVGVQWVSALLYAIPKQDERFFDLTGSVTFALVSLLALMRESTNGAGETALEWRSTLLTAMVWFWCVRLGSFLYLRIREAGEDTRFKDIRANPVRFLSVWSIQGLWVFLTVLPVLLSVAHSTKPAAGVRALDVVGAALWVTGYALEVVADYQKTQFRRDARNKGKFIQSGLWAYSRHPNYCGEITMWVGIFLVAVHTLPSSLYQGLAALSPVFVTLLLTKVSGIPLLEKQGDERWGDVKAYQEYKARTSLLLLWPTTK